jgi:hypothetical protein
MARQIDKAWKGKAMKISKADGQGKKRQVKYAIQGKSYSQGKAEEIGKPRQGIRQG